MTLKAVNESLGPFCTFCSFHSGPVRPDPPSPAVSVSKLLLLNEAVSPGSQGPANLGVMCTSAFCALVCQPGVGDVPMIYEDGSSVLEKSILRILSSPGEICVFAITEAPVK